MAAAASVTSTFRSAVKGAYKYPTLTPSLSKFVQNEAPVRISASHDLPMGKWSKEDVQEAVSSNVMSTWSPGVTKYGLPVISHGEGIYLYDTNGKQYIDWTSLAVCSNLGYTVPRSVMDATIEQMETLPYAYGDLVMTEIRARMSKLMSEIMPGDLQGMIFPSSGSEANEAAIMMARRYTGKFKVLSYYRSYHGTTGNALQATGDFRRPMFGKDNVPGFVKMFNPYNLFWNYAGETRDEQCETALKMLEEQILYEGPDTIALLSMEPVVGARGVLIPSTKYVQGVRSLCDKYGILMHCDEVMTGFGRTGKLFGFQNFEGVIPDIVTAAKGMSSSFLPLSMTACRKHIMEAFEDKPLGWGTTYQAHPVPMACAYENLKFLVKNNIPAYVNSLAPKFEEYMRMLAENHPSIKQYRSVGFFGAFDIHLPNGEIPGPEHEAAFVEYKKAYTEAGLIKLLRAPIIHVAPPLITSEEQLQDGFARQDDALYTLDEALGY